MSGIEHPPIEYSGPYELPLERLFAEEIYQTFALSAWQQTEKIDDLLILRPITQGYDVDSIDNSGLSLRLKGVIAFAIENVANLKTAVISEDYMVIEFQYSRFTENIDDDRSGELFNWQPYVVAIINQNDIDDIAILDAQTGNPLDQQNLAQALLALKTLNEKAKTVEFEEDFVTGYSTETEPGEEKYAEFETIKDAYNFN